MVSGSVPPSIISRHVTYTLWVVTWKLGFQKLGFYAHDIRSHSLHLGGDMTLHLTSISKTNNQDHWEVAIRCLPHISTGPDHHLYTRCRHRNSKSAAVLKYHCTWFLTILTYSHFLFFLISPTWAPDPTSHGIITSARD